MTIFLLLLTIIGVIFYCYIMLMIFTGLAFAEQTFLACVLVAVHVIGILYLICCGIEKLTGPVNLF